MTLIFGTKLGPYEITGALGAGGMGEVYRARDTKLQRDVALKILPESMARDVQRMARFEREARTLASLNHPNIAAIYGLEESNGVRALVMELVEGETLAERLRRTQPHTHEPSPLGRGWSGGAGPGEGSRNSALAIDDALLIAKQIAEALEYAHERGVIHRDLKPANVKITPEGTAKVLDFGLAKVLSAEDSTVTVDPANSPTLSTMATQAGMILGTAAYMSPEQAKGQRVDRRADIWAFGCVFYEMLSGRKPFEGETISDVLAAVIKTEPDWAALPESTPPSIQKLIHRCLQKDQRQRLRDIGEARITIEETLSGNVETGLVPALTETAPGGPRRSPVRRILPWAIAGLLAGALISGLAVWNFVAPAPQESPVLSYIPPSPNTTFHDFGFGAGPVVVSPDGKRLAFSATDENGVTKLYVRPLDSNDAKAISGTEDAAAPFWSPDGSSLGFVADQKLKAVNLANGNVEVLTGASPTDCATGDAWSPGGTILFTPRGCVGPLDSISVSGGKATPATRLEDGEVYHGAPAFLPDGRHFLYVSSSTDSSPSIWMGSLGSSEQKLVLKGASSPEFANGHLLFLRDGRIFAQPFDPTTGDLTGQARALAEAQKYSASDSGVLAFQGGTPEGRLEWYDRSGNPLGSVGPAAIYGSVRISPDGTRVLAEVDDAQFSSANLWSYPAAGGVGTRLTFGPGEKAFAVWSPDGKSIAYACYPDGKLGICRRPANGSGTEERLITLSSGISEPLAVDWSPDGRYLSLNYKILKDSRTVMSVLPLPGDRKPFQPAPVNADQFDGKFSPDGRWLAYFSYETGRPEVYVVPFPGPGGKFQISQNGGWNVQWDKKGHLYFLSMGNRLMEADLSMSGGSVQVKVIHPLFQLNLPSFADPFYDVSADGSRFLVVTSTDPEASRSIGLLLDWQSKLKGKE